jgi:HEAT repeat protein
LVKFLTDERFASSTGADREAGLKALESLAPQRVPDVLLKSLDSKTERLRAWACDKLATGSNERDVPALVAVLTRADAGKDERAAALRALDKRAPDKATEALAQILRSSNVPQKTWACTALGGRKDLASQEALRLALTDASAFVRREALESLAKTNGTPADQLTRLVEDPDPDVRRLAVQALDRVKDQAAVPGLMKQVATSAALSERQSALSRLQKLAPDRVSEALEAALASPKAEFQTWACRQLGARGDERSTAALHAALKHSSASTRLAAVNALAERRTKSATEAVAPLLQDPDMAVRQGALSCIALGGGGTVAALAPFLEESGVSTRALAAAALGRLNDPNAAGPLVKLIVEERWATDTTVGGNLPPKGGPGGRPKKPGIVRPTKAANLSDKDAALTALQKVAPERVEEAIAAALRAESQEVRSWAATKLQLVKNKAPLVPAFVKLFGDTLDEDTIRARQERENLIAQLEAIAPERVSEVVRTALTAKSDTIRTWAVGKLASKRDDDTTKALRAALTDSSPQVRSLATRVLAQRGDKTLIPALMKSVVEDGGVTGTKPSPGKGMTAYRAPRGSPDKEAAWTNLETLAPEKATEAALEALKAKTGLVRAWACSKLATKRDAASAQALIAALGDPADVVQCAAAHALGTRRETGARKALQGLEKDASPAVRQAASAALRQIGG